MRLRRLATITVAASVVAHGVAAQRLTPDDVAAQSELGPRAEPGDREEEDVEPAERAADPAPTSRSIPTSRPVRRALVVETEPMRPTRPWHAGRGYVQLGAIGSSNGLPAIVRVGGSFRRGLALGIALSSQAFDPPLVFGDVGAAGEDAYLRLQLSTSAFATLYPRGRFVHLDFGLGITGMSYRLERPDGARRTVDGVGPRALFGVGIEWRHPDARRQHWGLGVAVISGFSTVSLDGERAFPIDLTFMTTITWF